jgi:hypothetical protein
MTVARHVPDNLPACSIEPALPPARAASAGGALDALPPASDYSSQPIILGRLKPGQARESHRVVHVFALTNEGPQATTLTARCGQRLLIADIQWLPRPIGMPCDRCLLRSLALVANPPITNP